MKLHANARTCPKSRRLLVERLEAGWSLRSAAEAAGVSERTAAKWLGRWRAEGEAGLRTAARHRGGRPTRLPADRLEAVEALRRLRMTAAEIAEVLGMALSTVSRWLRRIGLGRRIGLAPPEPPNRYERKRPGELIHVDVKKLGRIAPAPGTGSPGTRSQSTGRPEGASARTGWEFVHVCVDDATRLAYVEVLADERALPPRASCDGPSPGSPGMGITVERVLSDNGACYRSRRPRRGLLGARHAPPLHPALPAPHQRQGRALHPDADQPLGLRRDLRLLGRAHRGAAGVARPLQLQERTRLPRSQAARSSARRAGTTS